MLGPCTALLPLPFRPTDALKQVTLVQVNQALQQLKGDIQLVVPAIEIVSIDGAAEEIEVVSMVRGCPPAQA